MARTAGPRSRASAAKSAAANRVKADSPSHSLYSHDANQGHVNQTGGPATAASLLGLAKSPAPSGGLTQMNGYQLGTMQL